VPPLGGEVIGDAPDRRVEILSDADEVNATWSRFGPHRDGADLHIHRRHTDVFYVLTGTLTVRLGVEDRQVDVPSGTLVRVPPMVVHGFRNAGDDELQYVNLHAPGMRFADYLRALRDGASFSYDQEPPPGDGSEHPASQAVIGAEGPWHDGDGVRTRVLADVEAVRVIELEAVAGRGFGAESAPHLRSLYVLDGELLCRVDGQELRAPARSFLQLPAGQEHVLEAGSGGVSVLDVRTPA